MLFLSEQTKIEKPINLMEASIDTVNSIFDHVALVESYIKDEFNTVLSEETKENFSTKIKRLIETCKNMIINAAKRVKAYIMKLIERVKKYFKNAFAKKIDIPENIVKAINACIDVEVFLMSLIGRVATTNRLIKETHEHDQFEKAFNTSTEALNSPHSGKTVSVNPEDIVKVLDKLLKTAKYMDEKLVASFSKIPVDQYNQFLGQNITYLSHEVMKYITLIGNVSTAYSNAVK